MKTTDKVKSKLHEILEEDYNFVKHSGGTVH